MNHPSKRQSIAGKEEKEAHGWVSPASVGKEPKQSVWLQITARKTLTCVVLCSSSSIGKQKQSLKQFGSLGVMDYATDNLGENQTMGTVMLLADKH